MNDTTLSVGIDVSAIPARLTGVGHYLADLLGALARRDDVEVSAFSRRGDASRWRDDGADAVIACAPRLRPARVLFGEIGLGRVARRTPGLAVFHGPHYSVPRGAHLPLAATVHDLTLVEHPEWHERAKVVVFGAAIRRTARVARAVICLSERDAASFTERFSPEGPVFVVPHGVDHERFSPTEPAPGLDAGVLARYGLMAPFIVSVGTVEPRKNLPRLVGAFDELASRDPELTLVIVGVPGWGSDALDTAVASSHAPERVIRLGHVEDAAIPAMFRAAAAVAYPSLSEGSGMPVLEALATGAAVVTSSGSVMEENAGGTAELADPTDVEAIADALRRAIASAGDEVRSAARVARAAAFTWDASAAGHVEAWRGALA